MSTEEVVRGAEGMPVFEPKADVAALDDVEEAMRDVVDPELGINVVDLGLVYDIRVDEENVATIDMTLTSPGCPVAAEMPGWVENAVGSVAGVGRVSVTLTFDPPWDKDRMSDEARLLLGMY